MAVPAEASASIATNTDRSSAAAGAPSTSSRATEPAAPGILLRCSQEVAWTRPPWEEPDAPLAFTVLYEDTDLLAVDKPAGLPTLPGANFLHSTLLHQVRLYAPDATALHRLGRFTS